MRYEELMKFLEEALGKHLAPWQERIQDLEKQRQTINIKDFLAAVNDPQKRHKSEEKGAQAARAVLALAHAKGDPQRAAAYVAAKWGAEDAVAKALSSSDATAGGILLPDSMSDEIIELLRPATVVRQVVTRFVDLTTGTHRIPKHTVGASGQWIGENQNAPATQPAFGQVNLTAKKYAALVPISNDLIRRGGPRSEMFVRDDLVAEIATAEDLAFIRGNGLANQPKGLRYLVASAHVVTANPSVSLANVTTDLGLAMQTLMDANVDMATACWIMEPRTWRYLFTVRDGNGNLVFAPEMANGTLLGFPFKSTSQIPRNLGGAGTGTELFFFAGNSIVIGDATRVLIDASSEAAYHDGSNVVAAFSLDQTVIRAIVETDITARHGEAIVVLDDVRWGV